VRNLIKNQDLCLFALLANDRFLYFIGTKKNTTFCSINLEGVNNWKDSYIIAILILI